MNKFLTKHGLKMAVLMIAIVVGVFIYKATVEIIKTFH